jgi:hypothetical protein
VGEEVSGEESRGGKEYSAGAGKAGLGPFVSPLAFDFYQR